jgi:hypothetical protein
MRLPTLISRLLCRSRSARPATTPARPQIPLRVEELEARQVPTAQTGATFIATLYQGFLSRPVGSAGLAYWGGRFATTGSATAVATGILQSPEFEGRELEVLYQDFLGRPVSPAGVNYWGNLLQAGVSYEQVKAGVLGSDEFFAHNGDSDYNFLNAVYQSQLGRSLDEAGRVYWGTQLATGEARPAVALQIMDSPEAKVVKVAGAYEEILGHGLTPAGASYWAGGLMSGQTDTWLFAGLAGSDEFLRQLNISGAPQMSDPNTGADYFLTQGHKFDVTLPGVEVLNRNVSHGTIINVGPPPVATPTPVANPGPAHPGPTTAVPGGDSSDGGDWGSVDDGSGSDSGDSGDPGAPTDDSGESPPADSGDNSSTDSGADTGVDPGSDNTTDPGSPPAVDPGTDPGTDPGSYTPPDSGSDTWTDPNSSTTTDPASDPTNPWDNGCC